jgi:hypothetical protein
MREKSVSYQRHIAIISRQVEGAALFFCARINGSLSIMVTRNNSGALLLTTFVLKPGAATIRLPRRPVLRFVRRGRRRHRRNRETPRRVGFTIAYLF